MNCGFSRFPYRLSPLLYLPTHGPLMFSVVLAVSDPLLLSVAALSARVHPLRVHHTAGISGLSGGDSRATWTALSKELFLWSQLSREVHS